MEYRKYYRICFVTMVSCLFLTGCHIRHDWVEATCTEPETCMAGGETKGEPLGHDWKEATCTEPEVCAVCEKIRGEPLGHIYTEATCTESAICAVCGETLEEASGHIWIVNACLEPQLCEVCGESGEIAGHEWNVEHATCNIDKKCIRCEEVEEYANTVKHELNETGVCQWCGQQLGILLSPYNSQFNDYISLKIITDREYNEILALMYQKKFYTYNCQLETVVHNPAYKFYNVEMFIKLYLTTDIYLGEEGAVGDIHDSIRVIIDEEGNAGFAVYTSGYRDSVSDKQLVGSNEKDNLAVFGQVYSIEGFCYDSNIATIAEE